MKLSPFRLLCGAGLAAIFSSTISKNPVLPLFASHLGGEPSWIGFIAGISAFTGIVASIPAGLLSDRLGRKRLLVASGVVFASAPFLYLGVTGLWQLALVRFFHGFATAIFMPVGMAMVSDLYLTGRGERLGWFSSSTLAGRFIAPMAGGALITLLAYDPELGFRAVYAVCGAAGIIALVLMWKLPGEGEGVADRRSWRQDLARFRSLISHRVIVVTAVIEAAILFSYGAFETFLPLFALEHGVSALGVGTFISAQIVTLAATKPLMGRFSDRHGRPPQIVAGALLGAACMVALPLTGSFLPMLAVSVVFGLSLSVVTSATAAFIADSSTRESHGSAMGILGSLMDIGHTTGPLAAGFLAGYYGLGWSFIGAAVVLALAALVFRGVVRAGS